jgi:hypothetical protein
MNETAWLGVVFAVIVTAVVLYFALRKPPDSSNVKPPPPPLPRVGSPPKWPNKGP